MMLKSNSLFSSMVMGCSLGVQVLHVNLKYPIPMGVSLFNSHVYDLFSLVNVLRVVLLFSIKLMVVVPLYVIW